MRGAVRKFMKRKQLMRRKGRREEARNARQKKQYVQTPGGKPIQMTGSYLVSLKYKTSRGVKTEI